QLHTEVNLNPSPQPSPNFDPDRRESNLLPIPLKLYFRLGKLEGAVETVAGELHPSRPSSWSVPLWEPPHPRLLGDLRQLSLRWCSILTPTPTFTLTLTLPSLRRGSVDLI